ncbi:MAG: hypothetical protein KGY75_02440 [Candidatus Cloacimonetes bacterium]|nr:hypothetical protein [Candidatus Cloacimonadota bacterium]
MKNMTSRERLTAVLNGEKPDYLPWSPLVDYYFLSSWDSKKAASIIDASQELEFDLMERHVPTYSEPFGASLELVCTNDVKYESVREEDKIFNRYITPKGTVEEKRVTTEKIKYGFIKKHYIEDIEDLRIYKYVLENLEFKSMKEEFKKKDKEIGEAGIAVPSAPLTPIQQFLQFLIGLEKTVYMLMDHPEEMQEVLDLIHEKNKECYEIILDYPSDVVIPYEDTSTTVLSPNMYENYCMDYIDEYAELALAKDTKYITHMCGKLSKLIDQLAAGKMDGIDSMCPPTSGDLWPYDAREELGDKKIIIGGIEPASLQKLSVDEVKDYVMDLLKKMQPGYNFILSTGDATPHGTPIKNLWAVAEIRDKYGKFPLNI